MKPGKQCALNSYENVQWAFDYWIKKYRSNFKKYGWNHIKTVYAYGNAQALRFALNSKRAYTYATKPHFGQGKRFKNTWLGKLLGLKNK